MQKITTESGFVCEIDEQQGDDMRIIEALVSLDDPDTTQIEKVRAVSTVLTLFIGAENKKALYAHLTEKFGRPSIEAVSADMRSIFNQLSDAKKN